MLLNDLHHQLLCVNTIYSNPKTITNIVVVYAYFVGYNQKLLVSRNFQALLSYKQKSYKASTFHFL